MAAKAFAKTKTKESIIEQREIESGIQDPVTQEADGITVEEHIRRRAYEIYLQRGDGAGSHLDDWLQAETEITHTVQHDFVEMDKEDLAAPDAAKRTT